MKKPTMSTARVTPSLAKSKEMFMNMSPLRRLSSRRIDLSHDNDLSRSTIRKPKKSVMKGSVVHTLMKNFDMKNVLKQKVIQPCNTLRIKM